jgi:Fe2+ transport system protein B
MTTQFANAPAIPQEQCQTCPAYNRSALKKLGVNIDKWDFVVALAGNPNTGKSTVFNGLTGLRQHVGNWPGKTVARAEGGFNYNDHAYKLVDLPGTYSLLSTSTDEEIARDFILFGQPDVTVVVIDATRIERNLNLALQILAITPRVVVALNLMDEAERHGMHIDERHLSRRLGVPVVPMVARRGEGLPELLSAIAQVAKGGWQTPVHHIESSDPALQEAVAQLEAKLQVRFPDLPNTRWVALRLLDGDESIIQAVQDGTLGDLTRTDEASQVITPENIPPASVKRSA